VLIVLIACARARERAHVVASAGDVSMALALPTVLTVLLTRASKYAWSFFIKKEREKYLFTHARNQHYQHCGGIIRKCKIKTLSILLDTPSFFCKPSGCGWLFF
jgi:hypothetical protein